MWISMWVVGGLLGGGGGGVTVFAFSLEVRGGGGSQAKFGNSQTPWHLKYHDFVVPYLIHNIAELIIIKKKQQYTQLAQHINEHGQWRGF